MVEEAMNSDKIDPRVEVLTELRKQTALLERIAAALAPQKTTSVDLDVPRDNPIIKAKDPRDWSGEPMTGRRFSECPPEYLDLLAERYDYFASREEDTKKKRYNELDATRSRAWAERLRSGWTAPVSAEQSEPSW
jgi:hypothetical protein